MIKLPGTRRGVEAERYWALAGAKLRYPPGSEFAYHFNTQSLVIHTKHECSVSLLKGKNTIVLPFPSLSSNVILMVELAPEMVGAELPYRIFSEDSTQPPILLITVKSDRTYEGPLAHYYLLSDR